MSNVREFDSFGQRDLFVIDAEQDERIAFVRRVYAHVGGAVAFCVTLIAIMLNMEDVIVPLADAFFGQYWIFLIGFMIASVAAHRMAATGANPGLQYAGLMFYAFAEAVFLAPFLYVVRTFPQFGGDEVIMKAGLFTLLIFGGLTLFVLLTKTDFSFLRGILVLGMVAAFALIIVSFFGGLDLGTWFSGGMIVLMSGFILWETSNVLHHYRTDQHVAASLAVFSSLATLFWYVLQFTAFDD